jgi:hypothetical protein
MKGVELADAENWRDLKTQKKIKILFEGWRGTGLLMLT